MRQCILGGNVAYADDINAIAVGALAVTYLNDGVPTLATTGKEAFDLGSIVLGRASKDGGNIVLPISRNNFTYTKMAYTAATKFDGEFTLAAADDYTDYTVIIVKKGVQFNERSNWSYVARSGSGATVDPIIKDLEKQINTGTAVHGIVAKATAGKLELDGTTAGVDYEIVLADGLRGTAVTQVHATIGTGTAAQVAEMMRKAAADMGIEYTYQDAVRELYPNYPPNPLAQPNAADTGFEVYTLRFNEPSKYRTMEDVVNTIIQVVLPHGGTGNAAFETVLKGLAGISA